MSHRASARLAEPRQSRADGCRVRAPEPATNPLSGIPPAEGPRGWTRDPVSAAATERDTPETRGDDGCAVREHDRMFDAQPMLENLQEAVLRGDRDALGKLVSDRMIWIMPAADNARGKQEWIDASCGVAWHWFQIEVLRTVELGDVVLVESLIKQSREPAAGEDATGPVAAQGIVADAWVLEAGQWRLIARHPHRID